MIPHHVQRNGGDPARLRAKSGACGAYLRQAIRHGIYAAMHENARRHVGRPGVGGITAYKIGHQVAHKRAVGQIGKVQVCQKIHLLPFISVAERLTGCSGCAPALD
jgi:hypothetical protein